MEWIKTLVAMASDRSQSVIMAKIMFSYFLLAIGLIVFKLVCNQDIHISFNYIQFRPNPIPK